MKELEELMITIIITLIILIIIIYYTLYHLIILSYYILSYTIIIIKVKELEEWECSVSRSVVVEVGLLSANRIRDVKTEVFCKRLDSYTKR